MSRSDDLEAEVEGKVCSACGLFPTVAYYQQRDVIRCDCGYDKAVLVKPKYTMPTWMARQVKGARERRRKG
jgi:hypothetical protein